MYSKHWLGCQRLAVLVSAVHAAVAAGRGRSLGLGKLDNQGLSGEKETGDRGCVLQCCASHLSRVDDAGLDKVLEDAGKGVVSVVLLLGCEDLGYDDSAFHGSLKADARQTVTLSRMFSETDSGKLTPTGTN